MKHKGLGDTIEALTTINGLKKLVPEGCGCDGRKKKLNKLINTLWSKKAKKKKVHQ